MLMGDFFFREISEQNNFAENNKIPRILVLQGHWVQGRANYLLGEETVKPQEVKWAVCPRSPSWLVADLYLESRSPGSLTLSTLFYQVGAMIDNTGACQISHMTPWIWFPAHLCTEADLAQIPDGLHIAKFCGSFDSI